MSQDVAYDRSAATGIGRGGAKVWICHATSSEINPYNLIHVSANAWDGEGRNDHTLHVGDYEASGPDEECGYNSGDDGGGDDGGTGGDDGGGTGGDSGGGDDGSTGGDPPQCFDYDNEADCTGALTCVWDGAVCLPAGIEL